jgi:hypothetical protein
MKKRPVKVPLLLTQCDCCERRRVCAAAGFALPAAGLWTWVCRACIAASIRRARAALREFRRQGR